MGEQTLKQFTPPTDWSGKTFGQRVRERRTELNITQEDLTLFMSHEGVEFSQSFLSQIENDRFDPNRIGVEKAMALCSALNMSFGNLFWGLQDQEK